MSIDDLSQLAQSQLGLVRRDQALAAGLTTRMIQTRLSAGEWIRVLPSVYRIAASQRSWEQNLMALHLWAAPSAVSHRSAGCLLKLRGVARPPLEITTSASRKPPWKDVRIHVQRLAAGDCENHGPFLITSPTRTIIDLASVLSESNLEQALDDALRRGLTSISRVQSCLSDGRGRRGIAKLKSLLREREGGYLTESPFESRVARLLMVAGLRPVHQYQVMLQGRGYRIDLAFPDQKLAIECQGYAHHSSRQDWERDQQRQNDFMLEGWRTLVVTWRQLEQDPQGIVALVHAALVEMETSYLSGSWLPKGRKRTHAVGGAPSG